MSRAEPARPARGHRRRGRAAARRGAGGRRADPADRRARDLLPHRGDPAVAAAVVRRHRRRDARRARAAASASLLRDARLRAGARVQRAARRRGCCSTTRANERKLDVFVGSFEMCHTIPITERIELDEPHDPARGAAADEAPGRRAERQGSARHRDAAPRARRRRARRRGDQRRLHREPDGRRLGPVAHGEAEPRADARARWGRSRSTTDASARVVERADALWERIEREPKSRKWRVRDRVGDRKRWYEVPDEVRR